MAKLTPQQIANWRKVLPVLTGWPATILSDEDIQKLAEAFNRRIKEETACSEENSGSKTDA